ncbi:MAG TPA: M1 family metallopeptidase [Cyclobacteriaceae bacterium]|nr:M1 family metallopeptidase [Cyclobacteriaceae bacterium]
MQFVPRAIPLFFLFGISVTVVAQQWKGKFEQLGPNEIPTPNSYRSASGSPGPDYWQQRADYSIDAEVNDETQELNGRETITYHNNSPEPLRYLWLQLDQNIFARNNLTSLTKSGGLYDSLPAFLLTYSNLPLAAYDGGFKIKTVKDGNNKTLPYVINHTMMRIDLPVALKSGDKFSFSVEWSYKDYDRMLFQDGRGGYEYFPADGNYLYAFTQWFPRMCVFDDFEGWQNKQFLGQAEFALTFGNYDVKITVPSDHIVGATGSLQNAKEVLSREELERFERAKKSFDKQVFIVTEEEARKKEKQRSTKKSTWIFRAENVRDFAFTSSRKFIWDGMAVKVGDKTPLAMSLYPKEGNPLWGKESTKAVKNTLEVYSSRTIDYPYPVAYSVHTADIGMEYPMICFNWGRPNADGRYSQATLIKMVSVIVHEVGHNFFPMIVNSDERQWAWMDEGINTFLEGETIRDRYPELNYSEGLPRSITGYMRGDKSQMRPVMTSGDNISEYEYGPNAYYKPAASLTLLRRTVMGPELFDKAFKTYAERWAFKHPKPADFFRTMEDASGVDLDWFWRGWFYGTDAVDIEVDDVKWYKVDAQVKDLETRGKKVKKQNLNSNGEDPGGFSNGPQPFSIMQTPQYAYGEFRNRMDDQKLIQSLADKNIYEITIKNTGGLVTPVIIEWTFKDGSKEIDRLPAEIWRIDEDVITKVFVKEKEVVSVVVDPNFETGDVNIRNNFFPKRNESKFDSFKRQAN